MKYALFALFIFAAATMPWWLVVPLGILVTTVPYGAPVAVLGGLILDGTYGAAVPALYGFEYLYTAIFIVAVAAMGFFSDRIAD